MYIHIYICTLYILISEIIIEKILKRASTCKMHFKNLILTLKKIKFSEQNLRNKISSLQTKLTHQTEFLNHDIK